MDNFSWNDPKLQITCGQCHYKDENPELCHSVEPPRKKVCVPQNISSCVFLRESYWQRMPQEKRDEEEERIKRRSKWFYSKDNGDS